jgi:Type II secretion system (T2SS), protein M subtype b
VRPLAKRERQGIAILLLVALIALVQLVVIGPIVDSFAQRAERRAALEQQYLANQRLVTMVPRLRRQAEQQRSQLQFYAMVAPDPAVASTALLERLQKTLETAGGELRSVEEVSGDDGVIRGRVSARMTLAQLAGLLARVHNEPPYLSVSALAVNADQAVISRKLEPLDVSLEVSVPLVHAAAR